MDVIHTPNELMERIQKLTEDDSVCQVLVPEKGQVTIVFQGHVPETIASDLQADPELRELIESSRKAYRQGDVMTTSELLKSLSAKDFAQ